MKKPMNLRRIFVQLRAFNLHIRYLRLALSNDTTSMQKQIEIIIQTRKKLQFIQSYLCIMTELVMVQAKQKYHCSDYYNCLVLIKLGRQLQRLVYSLLHLTEEYFIDPIGVQACLEYSIDTDLLKLQDDFAELSATKFAPPSNPIATNSAA